MVQNRNPELSWNLPHGCQAPNYLSPHLLPPRCIRQKLGLEMESELEPRHWNVCFLRCSLTSLSHVACEGCCYTVIPICEPVSWTLLVLARQDVWRRKAAGQVVPDGDFFLCALLFFQDLAQASSKSSRVSGGLQSLKLHHPEGMP